MIRTAESMHANLAAAVCNTRAIEMRYLTEAEYNERVEGLHSNWDNYRNRWHYHQLTIDWLKELHAEAVLEIGSLGIRLTDRSEAMDFGSRWDIDKSDVDYMHDMREIPWPVGHYDAIVGLRSFHYCGDKLRDVFDEAMRVGDAVILALPHDFDISPLPAPDRTAERLPTNTNLYLWKSRQSA